MPNNDQDLNIDDLDNTDDVKGGRGRPSISEPGIGRDLPRGGKRPGELPGKLQPGVGGPKLPDAKRP